MSSTRTTRRTWLRAGPMLALALPWALGATAQQSPAKAPVLAVGRPTGAAAPSAGAKPGPLLPLTPAQVLALAHRSVGWYHDLAGVEQLSMPGIGAQARSQLQQQALTTIRLAFQFGKAAEDILGRESPAQAAGTGQGGPGAAPTLTAQLDRAAADLSTREARLKSELTAADAEAARARGAEARAAAAAQRAGIAAALQLVQQIETNVDQLRRFQESAIAGQGKLPKGLRAQLAALEKSVPELSIGVPAAESPAAPAAGVSSRAPPVPAAAAKTAGASFQPQSAGIVTLVQQWFALHDDRVQVEAAIADTTRLAGEVTDTRSLILAKVRALVGSGMAAIGTGGAAQLAAQRQAVEAATGQLRELSSVLVPLGEQALALAGAQGTLDDWTHTLAAQESSVLSFLGLRVGFALGWIVAVLVISEIWRRATFRYLADARRRRPFLMLRRVVIGLALILVVIFSLVSQVGSVATYAGFVTAGVAVALQNVILAVVAYFFLIGRYGVRVGDRVTISGVTGRVVDISLLRIYLMELASPDLHSTGRMVVLSNAVLFQPTALFKQIPGAEYLWHSVTLTIVATADVEVAYTRLRSAANRVYDTYRAAIESQHALAQRFIEFETTAPVPEVRVRLTDTGLECAVRYPVVPEKSARIDQEMLEALRKAVELDGELKLVASGGMVLKSPET